MRSSNYISLICIPILYKPQVRLLEEWLRVRSMCNAAHIGMMAMGLLRVRDMPKI
jgi:hypothetical protein